MCGRKVRLKIRGSWCECRTGSLWERLIPFDGREIRSHELLDQIQYPFKIPWCLRHPCLINSVVEHYPKDWKTTTTIWFDRLQNNKGKESLSMEPSVRDWKWGLYQVNSIKRISDRSIWYPLTSLLLIRKILE